MGLRFSEQIGTRHVEIYPTVHEIRATIGAVDEQPVDGQFSLKVGGGSPVLGTNVTTLLNYNFTAAELQAALRVLTGLSAASVVEDEDSFLVRGVASTISVLNNTLRPISFVRVLAYEVDGSTTQAIRLQRAPYAFTDVYDQRVPDGPKIERISAGGAVDDIDYPEIQKLTVPLDFQNGYQLKRTDPTLKKSALLGVADGPDEIAAAINPNDDGVGLADDVDGVFTVEEHPTDPASIITFGGSMIGTGYDLLEVEVFDPKPGDYWIHLNIDTAMTAEAFRAAGVHKLMRVPIEIFADIEGDDEVIRTVTIYQGEVTIRESVTHGDLATAQHIDWINPPTAKQYAPVSPESLTEGARFWPFLLGNGSDIEFQKTHSLNSPRIRVNLRENITGGRELVHGTDFDYFHDDDDAVTITLLGTYAASPPALNGLTGTVQDLTLTSTWLLPVGIQITDVANLRPELDGIAAAIAAIQLVLPQDYRRPDRSAGAYLRESGIPNFSEVYPAQTRSGINRLPLGSRMDVFDPATLGRGIGRLFGALHKSSTVSLDTIDVVESGVKQLPEAGSSFTDKVYANDTGQIIDVPGGGGHPSRTLASGEFVACDGDYWHKMVQYGSGASKSYYPVGFERTLFYQGISGEDLISGRAMEALVDIELGLLEGAESGFVYYLAWELGTWPSDTTPSTTGGNLQNIIWAAAAAHEERILLSTTPDRYSLGYRVTRDGDTLTATVLNYGVWKSATAPAATSFAVRLRLIRGDTENAASTPNGRIFLSGPTFEGSVDGVGKVRIF